VSEGKRRYESSKSVRRSDAVHLLNQRLGKIADGVVITPQVGKITLGAGLAAVVADQKVNHPASAGKTERRIQTHILAYWRAETLMAAITRADLDAYVAARLATKAAHATINRELAVLRRAYRLALKGGTLMTMPKIRMLREDNIRTGFFERDEYERVRQALPEYLRPVVTLAYYTGWRRSELLALEWRQVDFANGTIRLDPGTTKNQEGRTFVFEGLDEVRTMLEAQRKLPVITPYVFHLHGEPIQDFRGTWEAACTAAKCPGRLLHDFRRTAVRNMVRAGIPERVVMQISGHKTRSVFERYNIVVSGDDLKDAARKLNQR
jgi:integrase